MSPPIMSRFDLFFVILDECHETTDFSIAQHIINYHRFREQGIEPDYSLEQLKLYLTFARGLKPRVCFYILMLDDGRSSRIPGYSV